MRSQTRGSARSGARGPARALAVVLALSAFLAGCSGAGLASLPLTKEQKVADFRYLSRILIDNHPFLWVAERKTGYDWREHIGEFEAEIAATASDEEFAKAVNRILNLLNNGHTGLVGGWAASNYGGFVSGLAMKRWKSEVRKTTAERADYWANLAGSFAGFGRPCTAPFCGVYVAGQYIVAELHPGLEKGGAPIQPGWTIAAVDGVPVNEYVKGLLGEQVLWYEPLRSHLYQRRLTLSSTGQDSSDGQVTVSFGTREGGTRSVGLPAKVPAWNPFYSWPPRYRHSANDAVTDNMFATLLDKGVAYVQIRSMARDHGTDMKRLRKFMMAANPKALVIDIRGNGGGSDNYWRALVGMLAPETVSSPSAVAWRNSEYVQPFVAQKGVHKLARLSKSELEASPACRAGKIPPEIRTPDFVEPALCIQTVKPAKSLGFRGKVCLLVDEYVFSSAESFAAFCKGSGWATLVGSCTGGDGIGYDPALVTLPNSGMLVRFPLVMGLNPDMSANEEEHTRPDVLVEWGVEDILLYVSTGGSPAGPDPAWDPQLRACLKWIAGE